MCGIWPLHKQTIKNAKLDGYKVFKASALSHLKKLVVNNVIVIKANNQKKI